MSTRAYADQLRNSLLQARDKLIAAMDSADGTMNAAQAKLAQQTEDDCERAEAHERTVLLQSVMRATEGVAVQVGNLTNTVLAAAGSADDTSTGLLSALEDCGRVVRGCVEAKDSLLGEVERVAGIARNHLRGRSSTGGVSDPLCLLAERVARSVEAAGVAIETMQQASVRASILAAQSLSSAAHDQWREAASSVTTVQKEASVARNDAATIAASTLDSSQEVRAARFATWEQRSVANQAMLAFHEGIKKVDAVINGSLQVSLQNRAGEVDVIPGFSATFRVDKPVLVAGGADRSGKDRPRLAFLAVPSDAATGFTRSAAEGALSPPPDSSGQPQPSRAVVGELVDGGAEDDFWSFRTKKPLSLDVYGNELVFGLSYRVFAAELVSGSGAEGDVAGEVARLSLPSLPLIAARTVTKLGKPRVHQLSTTGPGRSAFVVCFDHVKVKGDRRPGRSSDQPLFECRLLLVRESVWESWSGKGIDAPFESANAHGTSKALPKLGTGGKPGLVVASPKSAKDAKDEKGAPMDRESSQGENPSTEEALDSQLAIEREITLAAALNGADWTELKPWRAPSSKSQVHAVWERYRQDMRYVRGASVPPQKTLAPLKDEEVSILAAAFSGGGKEATPPEYVCYFNPYAAALDQNGVQAGRYTDISGNVLDLDMNRYVAVVYVAGVPQDNNNVVVESAISQPSEPFGGASAA